MNEKNDWINRPYSTMPQEMLDNLFNKPVERQDEPPFNYPSLDDFKKLVTKWGKPKGDIGK
jgi:hypothetical protein